MPDHIATGALPENDPLYAPCLKRRKRVEGEARYFVVPAKDVKAGYVFKTLLIPTSASEMDCAALCRKYWAELDAWRQGLDLTKPVAYTFGWLIDRYLGDTLSPFHTKQPATQSNYRYDCAAIRGAIGKINFEPVNQNGAERPRIVGEDIRRWHHAWGHPKPYEAKAKDGTVKTVTPGPTPSRARHLIMMLRTLVSYGVEIGAPGAIELRQRLAAMTFPVPQARTKAPTYAQVVAFVDKAVELGFRSQAIATLGQYELIERRVHIIGQWHGKVWWPGWEWAAITPDWRIQYYQTKTKAKTGLVLREFDLKATQRLLGLMQETPKEARTGAVILCELTGKPWTRRFYQEKWREIARAAAIPDDVWSMDMRAGGVTEADGIPEITPRMIQDGAGHADIQTQEIYRRDKQRNANKVVVLRQEWRARDKP